MNVTGLDVDAETRCTHYHSERDIIAIKFKCCGKWFPCHKCHAELTHHAAEVWPKEEFNTRAVLCGGCGQQMAVHEYLDCGSGCPHCSREFNPGCGKHHGLYFNVGGALVPRSVEEESREVAAPRHLPHSRQQQPHSANLRLHCLSDASVTFFVTKSLHPKKLVLNPEARAVVVSAFHFAVAHERIYLRAFVVMPDHWHALFALREPWTLPKFMQNFMSYVGAKTNPLLRTHKTAWQDSYYDTRVKTAKQFEDVAYYIEQNPVVKGLAELPEHWDGGSASCKELVTDPWPMLYD